MKSTLIYLSLFLFSFSLVAQRKQEGLTTKWPPEYQWQVAKRIDNEKLREIFIIPGKEDPKAATIMGVIAAIKEPARTADFVAKWSAIFRNSKLSKP